MGRRRRKNKARDVAAKPAPWPHRRSILLGAVAASLAVVLFWRSTRSGTFTPRAFNVIVVTADTLRADRLGVYGNRDIDTPNLDRLAERGVVFDNASTAAPLTLPAHVSIFTGTYPIYHGVRDNGGYYLDASHRTLAEVLRAKGYRTGAFVGAFVLDSRFGLDQGFEHYFDGFDLSETRNAALNSVSRRGGEVLEEALGWMEGVRDERFFAWLHFYDPHRPYDPPEPYRSRYTRGRFPGYDGEVAYVDALVGELTAWLEDAGLTESTVVVFLADHGEALGDHGEETHGLFVYDETMRVPFILAAPGLGARGRPIQAQVRTIDLVPTLLELVGADIPETVQGTSLVPLMTGEVQDLDLAAYGESVFPSRYGWASLSSLRTSTYHYIDAPRPELYDVAADPGERDDVVSQRAGTARELSEELDGIRRRYRAKERDAEIAVTVDTETAGKLRALGYLGAPARPEEDGERGRADPKDKIELYRMLRAAATASSEGRLDEAARALERVLAQDRDIPEAHNLLGDVLFEQKRFEDAAVSYREALRLDPDYLPSLFSLALTYEELGRRDAAALGFERVLELDPKSIQAALSLAEIRIGQKRFDDARRVLGALSARGTRRERALRERLLAECHLGRQELDEAQKAIERALAIDEDVPGARKNLGIVLEQRGDLAGAVEAYRGEVAIAPANAQAHFDLARALAQTGAGDEMLGRLERAVELDPRFTTAKLYLANAYLDRGRLDRALALAEEALRIGPEPKLIPFGHFILADVYERMGRKADAARELALAKKLQGS